MTRYDLDCQEISRIQFHTDFDRKTKNKMIEKIELRMAREEQKDLDRIKTNYFTG